MCDLHFSAARKRRETIGLLDAYRILHCCVVGKEADQGACEICHDNEVIFESNISVFELDFY